MLYREYRTAGHSVKIVLPTASSTSPASNPVVSHGSKASINKQDKHKMVTDARYNCTTRGNLLFIRLENGILAENSHFLEEPTPFQWITLDLDELNFEETLRDTLNVHLALK